MKPGESHLTYARSRFRTRLPLDRSYTRGHHWLQVEPSGVVRVGFTRFATRMLGEIVEMEFEAKAGDPIEVGQTVGWFEGFKAVSDLYAPIDGRFVEPNPDLDGLAERIHKDPYGESWLYRIERDPDAPMPDDVLSPERYATFLDGTIDKMMGTGDGVPGDDEGED